MSFITPSSASPRPLPTHHEVATFIESFLPPPPRPRDVNYVYHTPWEYRPRPASGPALGNGNNDVDTNNTNQAPVMPASPPPPPPQNTTLTSHITFAIVPCPNLYASLRSAPSPPSLYSTSRMRTAPLAFIHRPWALDRAALPRGTTVLASHTGFDERLTVGWNVGLAGRLGVVVGSEGGRSKEEGVDDEGGGMSPEVGNREGPTVQSEGGEGKGLGEGEVKLETEVEEQDHRRGSCYCIQGYKGDSERRIGLVGGFGYESSREDGRKVVGEDESMDSEEEEEDGDGGVKLHSQDIGTNTNTDGKTEMMNQSAPTAVRVRLNDLLARINAEFAGVGEVFDFSSQPAQETSAESVPASKTTKAAEDIVATDAVAAFLSEMHQHDLNDVGNTTGPSNEHTTPLLPPSTSFTTPEATPSHPEQQPPPPPQQPYKRQKKAKAKPKAPPPEPLPPSIPLATAAQGSTFPGETHVTAIAIMNAFHPEEIERAISSAKLGGWISWEGVGIGRDVASSVLASEMKIGVQATPTPATHATGTAHDEQPTATSSFTTPPSAPSYPPAPAPAALTPSQPLSQTLLPPQLFPRPSPYPSPPSPSQQQPSRILLLTGAPRAPGLQHIKQHYADRATVVCVGHDACEEWGVSFLAKECVRRWPGVRVGVVGEEHVEKMGMERG